MDHHAIGVYKNNHKPLAYINENVDSLVDFHVLSSGTGSKFAYHPEITNAQLQEFVGSTDVFLAGPPCEGHSNLNNKTRRDDPRNRLYLSAVAMGVALQAKAIVIENVPDVTAAKGNVVEAAINLLSSSGYTSLSSEVLATHNLGGAQTRRRFFLVATISSECIPLSTVRSALQTEPLPVSWAISDLLERGKGDGLFDVSPVLSPENQRRIEWLFANDKYNLADTERPDCHKNGHTYPSVCGRLGWENPSQTITT
jgi:DNA (cytosine-5)-methyltransferase 1